MPKTFAKETLTLVAQNTDEAPTRWEEITVHHTRASAVIATQEAEESFLHRLEMGGLTVTNEARRRWWPLAHR